MIKADESLGSAVAECYMTRRVVGVGVELGGPQVLPTGTDHGNERIGNGDCTDDLRVTRMASNKKLH